MRFVEIAVMATIFCAVMSILNGLNLYGVQLPGVPEAPQPPEQIFQYKPGSNPASLLGDFIWGASMILTWMTQIPSVILATMYAIGIPDPWASVLAGLTLLPLALLIIYVVSGRVLE